MNTRASDLLPDRKRSSAPFLARLGRKLLRSQLRLLRDGELVLVDPDGTR